MTVQLEDAVLPSMTTGLYLREYGERGLVKNDEQFIKIYLDSSVLAWKNMSRWMLCYLNFTIQKCIYHKWILNVKVWQRLSVFKLMYKFPLKIHFSRKISKFLAWAMIWDSCLCWLNYLNCFCMKSVKFEIILLLFRCTFPQLSFKKKKENTMFLFWAIFFM